jgi:hypothetical protein
MSALRGTVDFGQLICSAPLRRPDLGRMNCVRLLATEWNRSGEGRAVRLRRRSGLPGTRTLSPCDAIFFYYTAILWTGLRGVLAAVRLDR